MIFQDGSDLFAWRRPDPVILSLVCRFWHAIVTGCPNLWTRIVFEQSKGFNCALERVLTRAGNASLSLEFRIDAELYLHDEERLLGLFSRCRELRIIGDKGHYTFPSSITMPYLEHIDLNIDEDIHIEPLLDSMEKGSPLLRSLSIFSFCPTNLARHRSLLRRIFRCDLMCITANETISLQGFQNVAELEFSSFPSGSIIFCPSYLPNLVSLSLENDMEPPENQQLVIFPLLENLHLSEYWSNLQFIAAPKLRNLVLTFRDREEPEEVTMSALRRSPVRPMSLSIDFFNDTYMLELLKLWSNLSELHIRRSHYTGNTLLGLITTAALAGSRRSAPLCPSLRYLTVDMGMNYPKLVNRSIQRLQKIVKKRKGYGVIGLQRVMCIWDYGNGNEVQWVDVL